MSALRTEPTRTYRRALPSGWWLQKGTYFFYMLREFTSFFVALFAIFLIVLLSKISQGPEAFSAWLEILRSPGMVLLHGIILAFLLLHTVTWFRISGRIFPLKGNSALTEGVSYALWALVSIVAFLWLV